MGVEKMALSFHELKAMCGDDRFFSLLAENLEIEADGGDSAGDFVRQMVQKTRSQIVAEDARLAYEKAKGAILTYIKETSHRARRIYE